MPDNNISVNNYINVLFEAYSELLLPLYNNQKRPTIKNWPNKQFTIDDFEHATGVGIRIHLAHEKGYDLVCFDIDLKDESITETQKIAIKPLIDQISQIGGVYIEQTPSNGYHIWFKMTPEDLKRLHDEYTTNDCYIAKHVEVYPSKTNATRQIVIYPSKVDDKSYVPLKGDITNLNYVPYETVKLWVEYLRIVLGELKTVETEVKTEVVETKTEVEITLSEQQKYGTIQVDIPDHLKKPLDSLHSRFVSNPNLIAKAFDYLHIWYRDLGDKYVLYSLYTDDGKRPSSYVFKNSVVYTDHHLKASNRLAYCLYSRYPNETITLLFKLEAVAFIPIESVEQSNALTSDCRELVIAPCGYGKTRYVVNMALSDTKIILLVPYGFQVEQFDSEYDKLKDIGQGIGRLNVACLSYHSRHKKITNDTTFIIATYDQLPRIKRELGKRFNEFKIVIDEAHEVILQGGYKLHVAKHIWQLMKEHKQYTLLTATPHFLQLQKFVDRVFKVKPKKRQNRFFQVIRGDIRKLVKNVWYHYTLNLKVLVFIDDKQKLEKVKASLIDLGVNPDDIAVITSENRNDAKTIATTLKLSKRITLTTRILSTGINIIEDGQFAVHIVPSDINVFVQSLSRIRETNANTVFAFAYIARDTNVTYDDLQEQFENVYRQVKQIGNDLDNLKQLFLQVYGKGGKRYIRDNEELLCLAKDYDQAAIKLAYDIVTRRAANSVQLVEQLAKEEGWTIRQNLPLNLDKETELKDTVQNSTFETFEHVFDFYWNNYDKIDERNIKHKDWKKVYQIVKTLKTYPEIFDDNLIEQYKKQITEGKISSVKRSISKTIDKWRLENWDRLDAETKARIAIVYLHFRKYALERLKYLKYKNYITFDEIKRIERKIGSIPTHIKSGILKSLGLRKDINKKRWVLQKLTDNKARQQVANWITEIEQILDRHPENP